ncbi:phosphosulfolactate synthase [Nocardia sp. NPDC058114]|uniref:phosphosulfolactate synthase n=1 Tax=Nocardia sp. NPDC058114 TaxID=3346346 RepID=UPI0036D82DC1
MTIDVLGLPARQPKPRSRGLTVCIDSGLPISMFQDVIESNGSHLDIVKFGWGTALVTGKIEQKLDVLRHHGIEFLFGGTLFEKYASRGCVDEYRRLCLDYGCRLVEISNGTIEMDRDTKGKYIDQFARDFDVFGEVGFKDQPRSELLSPSQWIEAIESDLHHGAKRVLLESRESATSGICRPDGELRIGLIEDILKSDVGSQNLIFETPTSKLQTYFIKRIGPEVNLGNIGMLDIVPLETLRLGLRSDTLLAHHDHFEKPPVAPLRGDMQEKI